jgi:Fe-S cluster assembly protein SufD
VPLQVRSARFASFDVADFEAVTGNEAEWKHTPIARVQPLIDGILDADIEPVTGVTTSGDSMLIEWVPRQDSRISNPHW